MGRRLLFVPLLLALSGAASGQPATTSVPPAPRLTLGAEIFADYTYSISPKASDVVDQVFSPSAFNVSRALVDVQGAVTQAVSLRIAPDVVRETDSASSRYGDYLLRLRYGYGNVQFDRWTRDWKNVWVRLGLQPTPLVEYEERAYRYRFQGPVFVERTGALAATDTGVSVHSDIPGEFGDVHVGVYNGRGSTDNAVSGTKAFEIRGTVHPLAFMESAPHALTLTVYHDRDRYLINAPRTRTVINATVEHARVNGGAEYLTQLDRTQPEALGTERRGWSVWVTPVLGRKGQGVEGLLRFDSYGRKQADATEELLIAGIGYRVTPSAGASSAVVLLDFEQRTFAGFQDTPATVPQRRVAVHAMVKF